MEKGLFVPRALTETISSWLNRKEGILIYGARQVGKSTLLKKLFGEYKNAYYISFDEEETLAYFRKSPQSALKEILHSSRTIFIDEFQKVPKITQAIKYFYDQNSFSPPKFFLSGSLSDAVNFQSESLAGRIIRFPLFTFSFREYLESKNFKIRLDFLMENIDIQKLKIMTLDNASFLSQQMTNYLYYGGYPATISMKPQQISTFFKSLKRAFLEKDLLGRINLGQLQNLENLSVILAKRVGFPLSYNSLAIELGVDIKTVKKLIDILSFGFWIEVIYPKSSFGGEVKNKFKVYFLDNGLRNYLAETGKTLTSDDLGPLYENAVFGILRRYLSYNEKRETINFWHTYSGGEIDFLIEIEGKKIAIEVKAKRLISPVIGKSVKNFVDKYQPDYVFIVNQKLTEKVLYRKTVVYFLPLYIFGLLV